MMNRRFEVQETLWKLRDENYEARRLAAVAQLPPHLRATAWQLLGYNEQGQTHPYGDWSARSDEQSAAARKLDTLPPSERLAIFAGLLPKIGPYLEAGWQRLKRFPYSLGGQRRAFRAPQRPELTLYRSSLWLGQMIMITCGYEEQSLSWFAEWAGYLWHSNDLGTLFAAAIDTGDPTGNEVFDILVASAKGEHETGIMGRHVSQALLCASRPEGWTLMEQLLIAAQRQEGLRQVILETVDEAHPEAFRRMVRLIREQNLTRFSSVVRAMNVWFGLGWVATETRAIHQQMAQLDDWLADEARCVAALDSEDPQTLYLALCVLAFTDATRTVSHAARFLHHPQLEHRFIGTHFLAHLELPEVPELLVPMITDPDLRVIVTALQGVFGRAGWPDDSPESRPELFETLEALLPRFPPQKKILEPLVWPWLTLTAEQQQIAHLLYATLGQRPLARLAPYIKLMSPFLRSHLAYRLPIERPEDPATRDILLQLMADRSSHVRRSAITAVNQLKLTETEAEHLERYLTYKAGDLRRGILGVLLHQPDPAVLASAQRLLNAAHGMQRQAGLELLQQLKKQERSVSQVRTLATTYAATLKKVPEVEQKLLDILLEGQPEVVTLENGLGLFDPAQRTPPLGPQARPELLQGTSLISPAAMACLQSLDELIHTYRETPILWSEDAQPEPLGNLHYAFPHPDSRQPVGEDVARLPLREVWEAWWAERPATLRDPDGRELWRALAPLEARIYAHSFYDKREPDWFKQAVTVLYGQVKVEQFGYAPMIRLILWWLLRLHPPSGSADFLLDAVEHSFSLLILKQEDEQEWRGDRQLMSWLSLVQQHRSFCPADWTDAHQIRLWRLLRWLDEPGTGVKRYRPSIDEAMRAYLAGGATQADLLDHLLGPHESHWRWGFSDLHGLSGRKPDLHQSEFASHPDLQHLVEQCRQRIVEVEVQRADIATAASVPALALRFSGGLDTLLQLLVAFGQEKFVRGWTYDSLSKQAVFSHLIRTTFPTAADTLECFATQANRLKIGQTRLIETALFAPQWTIQIEYTLGWPEFAEAVWWLHAHTKDQHWRIDPAIRERWQAEATERTPLTGQELLNGAVDVTWFQRVYTALGEERWRKLDEAAKYTSGGNGHRRAQLYAEAMLGHLDQATLTDCIIGKRNQDAVRAIGLLPLPADATREDIVLQRYELIQEFKRGSRKFGSQRQTSEKLAARIGLENLARTAGYPDPFRLEWAMEAHAVSDLASGPLAARVDEVSVTLTIDSWGEPRVSVSQNDHLLKVVPARLKKQPDIVALLSRKQELKRQAARMRQSLEQAMCRGDLFTADELQKLFCHPILKPMLTQLVFVDDTGSLVGYPDEGGKVLVGINQRRQPIPPGSKLRVAHPHDMLLSGEWHLWQQECFRLERIQPFKQIFRELYVLTTAEKGEKNGSRRYAGHQVNPRQALALLGQRGWVTHPEEGVRRTFHDEGIAAWLTCLNGYFTPAEVEGLTLEEIYFSKRGEWRPLPLDQVPPRLFSEVMRDLDLVVSVAHQGGVDPEATASTVEMRAALVRETCSMLKIDNVRLKHNHVFVDGALNHYTVHLGSAVVHQQPGGYVCIVPVHSQQRGRLFLPFADDDPKTAEVMAKVLLLARDQEIKDPAILEQIVRVG
jgi:hypothetical protein